MTTNNTNSKGMDSTVFKAVFGNKLLLNSIWRYVREFNTLLIRDFHNTTYYKMGIDEFEAEFVMEVSRHYNDWIDVTKIIESRYFGLLKDILIKYYPLPHNKNNNSNNRSSKNYNNTKKKNKKGGKSNNNTNSSYTLFNQYKKYKINNNNLQRHHHHQLIFTYQAAEVVCSEITDYTLFDEVYRRFQQLFISVQLIPNACKSGNLDIVKVLMKQTCPVRLSRQGCFASAALGGHIHILEYLSSDQELVDALLDTSNTVRESTCNNDLWSTISNALKHQNDSRVIRWMMDRFGGTRIMTELNDMICGDVLTICDIDLIRRTVPSTFNRSFIPEYCNKIIQINIIESRLIIIELIINYHNSINYKKNNNDNNSSNNSNNNNDNNDNNNIIDISKIKEEVMKRHPGLLVHNQSKFNSLLVNQLIISLIKVYNEEPFKKEIQSFIMEEMEASQYMRKVAAERDLHLGSPVDENGDEICPVIDYCISLGTRQDEHVYLLLTKTSLQQTQYLYRFNQGSLDLDPHSVILSLFERKDNCDDILSFFFLNYGMVFDQLDIEEGSLLIESPTTFSFMIQYAIDMFDRNLQPNDQDQPVNYLRLIKYTVTQLEQLEQVYIPWESPSSSSSSSISWPSIINFDIKEKLFNLLRLYVKTNNFDGIKGLKERRFNSFNQLVTTTSYRHSRIELMKDSIEMFNQDIFEYLFGNLTTTLFTGNDFDLFSTSLAKYGSLELFNDLLYNHPVYKEILDNNSIFNNNDNNDIYNNDGRTNFNDLCRVAKSFLNYPIYYLLCKSHQRNVLSTTPDASSSSSSHRSNNQYHRQTEDEEQYQIDIENLPTHPYFIDVELLQLYLIQNQYSFKSPILIDSINKIKSTLFPSEISKSSPSSEDSQQKHHNDKLANKTKQHHQQQKQQETPLNFEKEISILKRLILNGNVTTLVYYLSLFDDTKNRYKSGKEINDNNIKNNNNNNITDFEVDGHTMFNPIQHIRIKYSEISNLLNYGDYEMVVYLYYELGYRFKFDGKQHQYRYPRLYQTSLWVYDHIVRNQ